MTHPPRILVTCPPMLRMMDELQELIAQAGIQAHCPEVVQTVPESELVELVPQFEGWIIGDDPATRKVFEAGRSGRLRAAVKWGVGVDNVDIEGARSVGIDVTNTPGVFGREVADLAMGYILALARQTHVIDRGVREGGWPKPTGISLGGRVVGIVGFGDIGRNLVQRALTAEMRPVVWDPAYLSEPVTEEVVVREWPVGVSECDFLVFTCALTPANWHMLNREVLNVLKPGVRIVNMARGGLIDQTALIEKLQDGHVYSAALDVFEEEPLPQSSELRRFEQCIFGSHNGSNTSDAVRRASETAIKLISQQLHEALGRP